MGRSPRRRNIWPASSWSTARAWTAPSRSPDGSLRRRSAWSRFGRSSSLAARTPERGYRLREPAARADAAGHRHSCASLWRLRQLRGRRAGGCARGRGPVARRGGPGQPQGVADHCRVRRRSELWRSESARRRREQTAAALTPAGPGPVVGTDDTLTLLLLCCHPSLSPPAQVALTLRAVGGLTTAEIARALLVPEATVGQRISRAKQRIKSSGAEFRMPAGAEFAERIAAVLRVLYLIFNEGYTATSGAKLHRVELTA